jgi:adenylate cyclase
MNVVALFRFARAQRGREAIQFLKIFASNVSSLYSAGMKYRTKLYFALLSMSIVSAGIMMWLLYYQMRPQVLSQIKSQVLSIAGTTAALIDHQLLQEWIADPDESSEVFWKLKNELTQVVRANQVGEVFVQYAYLIKPMEKHPYDLIYVIDSEMDPLEMNHFGEVEPVSEFIGLLENNHLNEPFVPEETITDLYGTWISGYAPIINEQGKYIASVGIDLDAMHVFNALMKLLRYETFAFSASILVAIVGAFLLSRRATITLNRLCRVVNEIGQGDFSKRITIKTQDEFSILATAINTMAKGIEERERMQRNFAHYVSSHVMDRILKTESALELGGERKKVTMLFSDIRKFTTLSEQHSPEIIVSLLNEYFEQMIAIIFKYNGTLDKFLGDGLMVEFGAPLDDPQEELNAVRTAVEMQRALKELCVKWKKEGKPSIEIGIGIHTGIAIVGTIGSSQRMEYTAIGDTVNVASRIQAATRTLNVDILLSETTYLAVKDNFILENLGPIALPGRTGTLTLYNVKGEKNAPSKDN